MQGGKSNFPVPTPNGSTFFFSFFTFSNSQPRENFAAPANADALS